MNTQQTPTPQSTLALQSSMLASTSKTAPFWHDFDNAALVTMTHSLAHMIEQRDEEYRRQTAAIRRELQDMQNAVIQRIRESGGFALTHETLRVELDQKFVPQKRIEVLRQLEGLISENEFSNALKLVHPEPQWQANSTKLRDLARKYGGRVAQIIHTGMPHVPSGPTRLILEAKSLKLATKHQSD